MRWITRQAPSGLIGYGVPGFILGPTTLIGGPMPNTVLVGLTLIGLAACGGGAKDKAPKAQTSVPTATAPAKPTASQPTATKPKTSTATARSLKRKAPAPPDTTTGRRNPLCPSC